MSDTPGVVINTAPAGLTSAPSPRNSDTYMKWAQDVSEDMERLKMTWRGMEPFQGPDGAVEWKRTGKALLNEEGVSALSGIMYGIVNRTLTNSNYSSASANKRILEFALTLNRELRYKYKQKAWDMDLQSYERIWFSAVLMIDAAYRQAIENGWRDFGMRTISQQEVIDKTKPPQTSALSRLPFLGGR